MIVPVDVSVKFTTRGITPLVGVAVKLAMGTMAPVPVMALVEGPPLLLKTTFVVERCRP